MGISIFFKFENQKIQFAVWFKMDRDLVVINNICDVCKNFFWNHRRQLIVVKEIFTFKNETSVDYFEKIGLWSGSAMSQLAMWPWVESEHQIFLWCNKNGGVTLLTSQAYDKYQERYERDPTDLSQFLKMIGRLFSVRRLMKSVRILRVSMCVFVHAYTLVPI